MCNKGTCRRAYLNRLEYGGINLQKSLFVKKSAQEVDNSASHNKGVAHLLIHNKVYLAMTVFSVDILKPLEFFGQGTQGLGKHLKVCGVNRYLSRAGLKNCTAHTDDITDIVVLLKGSVLLADIISFYVNLNIALTVGKVGE